MSDYLRTVATRNLETTSVVSFPTVQPRTATRFEPIALDTHSPFAKEQEAGTTAQQSAPLQAVETDREAIHPVLTRLLGLLSGPLSYVAADAVKPSGSAIPTTNPSAQVRKQKLENDQDRPDLQQGQRRTQQPISMMSMPGSLIERIVERETVQSRPALKEGANGKDASLIVPTASVIATEVPHRQQEQMIVSGTVPGPFPTSMVEDREVVTVPSPTKVVQPAVPFSTAQALPVQPREGQLAESQLRPATNLPHRPQAETATPPAIQITIGRIEVRATQPSTQPQRRSNQSSPVMTLEAYLQERNGNLKGGGR